MTAPTDTRTDVDARRQRARRTALTFGALAVAAVTVRVRTPLSGDAANSYGPERTFPVLPFRHP